MYCFVFYLDSFVGRSTSAVPLYYRVSAVIPDRFGLSHIPISYSEVFEVYKQNESCKV